MNKVTDLTRYKLKKGLAKNGKALHRTPDGTVYAIEKIPRGIRITNPSYTGKNTSDNK
jgi:hypothetical protein